MSHIRKTEVILYVIDQQASAVFYARLLRQAPVLDVPGMTAFDIGGGCRLGLMPNKGIAKLLGAAMPHPDLGNGLPRCELYLHVDDVRHEFGHALGCGAKCISPVEDRDWGDRACYFSDPDGHIIAFAQPLG